MKRLALMMTLLAALATGVAAQTMAAHFDMSLDGGSISDLTTGARYAVSSQLEPFAVASPDGEALRFDGYSNYVRAGVQSGSLSATALTLSVVLAAETYPMMNVTEAEQPPTFATVCGNLDEVAKQGFALELSSQGDLRFRFGSAYSGGYLFTVSGTEKLPRGRWNSITATLDKANNAATLYLNGQSIGTARMSRSDIAHSTTDFMIGKGDSDLMADGFLINTFCGLIDDISVYNEVVPLTDLPQVKNASLPDFRYPTSRYESDLWRPQFHGMPTGGWTNETHGMTYSSGRYHLFFQKNANGPYMARLHWGHLSSENLYDWIEEPIALAPGENYDLKGCWSGCVYDDGGTPYILYTAVDNARAVIAQAKPLDETLIDWEKQGIVINGRPQGLSDDFRDPYYFEADGQQYIIVGTSKGNVGACTLHKLQNGAWTNDGTIFFQGSVANLHGTFWEMPNVTPMGDGRWLFTCTPLGTGAGVRTLCWVGTIGVDGKFTPDTGGQQYLEMEGISRDGYGLLSPTIYQRNGKTLLIGIVPDKLPTSVNHQMGWAHGYSLPREVSLAADGSLVQRPYSGLAAMRTKTTMEKTLTLSGTESLAPVSGRQIELLGHFTIGKGICGFNFLASASGKASLSFDTTTGVLTLDLSALPRQANDQGSYNGIYTATLPRNPQQGETLTLHVYLDGSFADIFVNDTWAFSTRLFPTDASGVEAEAFATSSTTATLQAWTLDASQSGDTGIQSVGKEVSPFGSAIYDLMGRRLSSIPGHGIYIINGKKYVAR